MKQNCSGVTKTEISAEVKFVQQQAQYFHTMLLLGSLPHSIARPPTRAQSAICKRRIPIDDGIKAEEGVVYPEKNYNYFSDENSARKVGYVFHFYWENRAQTLQVPLSK